MLTESPEPIAAQSLMAAEVSPLPAAEIKEEQPSLEETLMKKIRTKIESTPLPSLDETPSEAKSPSLLLSKAKWEAMASAGQVETTSAQAAAPQAPPQEPIKQSRYDTLMRFAAVELEGILKKE